MNLQWFVVLGNDIVKHHPSYSWWNLAFKHLKAHFSLKRIRFWSIEKQFQISLKKTMTMLFQKGHFLPLFLYFRLFNTVVSKCSIYIFADDWIRTVYLWYTVQPLYQLSLNHCPISFVFDLQTWMMIAPHFVISIWWNGSR